MTARLARCGLLSESFCSQFQSRYSSRGTHTWNQVLSCSLPALTTFNMRMTLVLVVALALLSSASAQRPSRLQQMVRGFMDDMSDMASRIGTGMLKSINNRPGVARENRPGFPGRKRQRPVPLDDLPARQSSDNLVAPNDPQRPRPVVRQERPRLTFRQFVDGTMAGLRNLFPRLTRRNFHRSARDVQQ